jgi:hypothetical protein
MIAGFPFIASSFDPDARAFVQTSGATDRAALNFFVKGIKRLGLWDDMVCWPLRSAQNAGTGSTAYSLGGLGTYNGTLVNGPTWGSDGIDFVAASSQSISTSLVLNLEGSGFIYSTTGGSSQALLSNRPSIGAWDQGTSLFAREASDSLAFVDVAGADGSRIRATGTPILSQFVFTQATHTSAGSNVAADTTYRQNKGARSSGAYVIGSTELMGSSTQNVRLAAANSGGGFGHFNGTIAAGLLFSSRPTASQQESLYDLYAKTLGQGLGLP